MSLPITRDEALEFLKSMPQLESDMNHYLESEAIMRGLAEKFSEDVEYWGMVGLLHDVDWSLTKDNLEMHCVEAEGVLRELGFDDEFIHTVCSHGYGLDIIPSLKDKERTEKIEYSLVATETLTGLIYAYALMRGGRVSDMKVKGLKKKFKSLAFAAACDRDLIREIEMTGLDLGEFFEIGIEAVKGIREDIGLE
jgi:putative nucleotidyltransferase with HDIG domain